MTDDEFDKYLESSYKELNEKQEILKEKYNLGQYEEYYFDQVRKVLQFKNEGNVELEFSIIFIGSWAKKKNDWLWAWANNSMTSEVRRDSEKLKKIYNTTGFDVFKEENMRADELQSWEITSLAVKELGAIGAYRVPSENNDLFVAIIELVR